MPKPRSDSKLFTLPVKDQLWIFEAMKVTGYKQVQELIREKLKLDVSTAALSNAWNEWSRKELEERVLKSKGLAADVIAQLGDDDLDRLDRATKAAIQQAAFELAMTGNDPKTVKNFYTLILKSRSLDIEVRKLADAIKSSQEKALDLLFEDIKGNAKAEKLFFQMRDALSAASDEAVKNLK